MGKNVTVQVGDELATKMGKLPDVNWSQVVRSCLERYCDIRLNPNIEALMQKMREQRERAYSEGYRAALEWFKQEEIGYKDVNEIFRISDRLSANFEDWIKQNYGTWENARDDGASPDEAWEREERRFWHGKIGELVRQLPETYELPTELTDAFVDGFKAALKKLEKGG